MTDLKLKKQKKKRKCDQKGMFYCTEESDLRSLNTHVLNAEKSPSPFPEFCLSLQLVVAEKIRTRHENVNCVLSIMKN
jgi:hypothetical protein